MGALRLQEVRVARIPRGQRHEGAYDPSSVHESKAHRIDSASESWTKFQTYHPAGCGRRCHDDHVKVYEGCVSGKEGRLIKVEYPPRGSNPIHRHNAHAFLYVLEGSIVMQLKGEKQVTLTPGQTFYESPNDIHTVSRNASNTEPAKFVVFLVKENGAPVLIPVK